MVAAAHSTFQQSAVGVSRGIADVPIDEREGIGLIQNAGGEMRADLVRSKFGEKQRKH